MAGGKKIRICDMTDSHLANAIALLERYAEHMTNYYIATGYDALASLRGEMAIMSVEQDMSYLEQYGLEPCEVHPLYENLIEEQTRRTKQMEEEKKKDFKFYVAGVQFREDWEHTLSNLEVGDVLDLIPEPTNKHDQYAVKVLFRSVMLGYVPAKTGESKIVSLVMQKYSDVVGVVTKVDPKEKPWKALQIKVMKVAVIEEVIDDTKTMGVSEEGISENNK
jgi:hypothetical protein